MRKKNIFYIFLCYNIIYTSAQDKISGSLYDKTTKEAIIQASIQLMSAPDSTFIKGTTTNLDGQFELNTPPGEYILGISYLGYKTKYYDINTQRGYPPLNLGKIYLADDGILLNEAVVTAKAAEIAVKGDTIEYNADSYKVLQSAVVEDLLKKMPGAEVNAEGKITINGKEIKKILVDGKEFFSDDPKVASKNLPASMVNKLQVLDRKTDMAQMTGFDDGEEETVINLTVKKGMKQGLFGNLSGGIGNKDRYGLSGIVNYMHNENQFTALGGTNNTNNEGFSDITGGTFRKMRHGRMNFGGRNGITESANGGLNFSIGSYPKLKWGGNIRYGHNDNDVKTNNYTEQKFNEDPTQNQYTTEKSVGANKSDNFNADLRFEWKPDSLTNIIFSPSFQYGKNKTIETSEYLTTLLNPADTINWGNRKEFGSGNNNAISGKLDISRRLNNQGRTLSFSFSGGYNHLDNDGFSFNQTTYKVNNIDSTDIKDRRFEQQNKGYNWKAYASYVEPIGRNNFLQFNYNIRKNYSDSDTKTWLNDFEDQYTIIDTTATKKLENNFLSQEIGINFKSVRSKYNYTIGFAVQPSNSESWTYIPNQEGKRVSNNVVNFSPVAQFNYLWSKRHSLKINYNGSTSQPTTTQLSNVRDESNPLNITYGNPNLKPAFNNRFRIRYFDFNPQAASAFILLGSFNFTTNDIVTKTRRLSGGRRETTYANINGNWNTNLRMIINQPLRNKKFSVSSMTFAKFNADNGFIEDKKNKANILTLSENIGINYRSDLFDFGLRGNINYSNTNNSLPNQDDRTVYTYGGNFNTTWYLPCDITFNTDVNYSANSGASQGFKQNEWLWNASISKQIFKSKNGTIKFDIYDILKQRNNISQSQTNYTYKETQTNGLSRFFMFSFIYKFQIFKGGAKMSDAGSPKGGYGRRGHRPF